MTYSDSSWEIASESLGIFIRFPSSPYEVIQTVKVAQVYEKFNQKIGINDKGGIGSSIEQNVFYNIYYFVFPRLQP
jgi:aspartokinase-like uncharacterized kinase